MCAVIRSFLRQPSYLRIASSTCVRTAMARVALLWRYRLWQELYYAVFDSYADEKPLFHSPTILLITDRTDLDDQLSRQFNASKKYIGDETVVSIDSRETLRQELQGGTAVGCI